MKLFKIKMNIILEIVMNIISIFKSLFQIQILNNLFKIKKILEIWNNNSKYYSKLMFKLKKKWHL
jgi:hypothetical protein